MASHDYIAQVISDAQVVINELAQQEQSVEDARQDRDYQRRRRAEDESKRQRSQLLKQADESSIYLYLNATQAASDIEFRSVWQEDMLENPNAEGIIDFV